MTQPIITRSVICGDCDLRKREHTHLFSPFLPYTPVSSVPIDCAPRVIAAAPVRTAPQSPPLPDALTLRAGSFSIRIGPLRLLRQNERRGSSKSRSFGVLDSHGPSRNPRGTDRSLRQKIKKGPRRSAALSFPSLAGLAPSSGRCRSGRRS